MYLDVSLNALRMTFDSEASSTSSKPSEENLNPAFCVRPFEDLSFSLKTDESFTLYDDTARSS